jgi:Tfp pilus assembly protein PilO
MSRTSWIFVIVTFAICAIIGFFFIRPVVASSWKTYKSNRQAKKDLSETSGLKDALTKLTKNNQLKSLYSIASSYIPQTADSGTLIIELSGAAEQANMTVAGISMESKQTTSQPEDQTATGGNKQTQSATNQNSTSQTNTATSSLQELPFTMKVSGTFTDFMKFLQNIETSSRLISVTALSLNQRNNAFSADITGKAYWKKGTDLEKTLANIQISQETIDKFQNLKTYGKPINLPQESGFGRTDPFAGF